MFFAREHTGRRTGERRAIALLVLTAVTFGAAAADLPTGTLADPIRFATFNASLYRDYAGDLIESLDAGDPQADEVAEIIQIIRPHVLLLQEFDYDDAGKAAGLFHDKYLAVGRNGADPIEYPYTYFAPGNNGVLTQFDLDNDGSSTEGYLTASNTWVERQDRGDCLANR